MSQVAVAAPQSVAQCSSGTHLVILTACLEQALLDGKLQKVVIIVVGRGLSLAAQHAVASRGLEQGGRDLASPAGGWGQAEVRVAPQEGAARAPGEGLGGRLTCGTGAADTGGVAAWGRGLAAGAATNRGYGLIAAIEVPKGNAGVEDVKDGDF